MPESRDLIHRTPVPQFNESFPYTPLTSASSSDNEIWMPTVSDSSEDNLPLFPIEDEARQVPSTPPMEEEFPRYPTPPVSIISPERLLAQIVAEKDFAREIALRPESPDRIQAVESGNDPIPQNDPMSPEPPVPAVQLSIREVNGMESSQVQSGASPKLITWVRSMPREPPPPFPIGEFSLPPELMPPEIFPLEDLFEYVAENLSGLDSHLLYPELPTEEPTQVVMDGLTRQQRLRQHQDQRQQLRNGAQDPIRRDQRGNNVRNHPDQTSLEREHYQLIRQHLREDGILQEGDREIATARQGNLHIRSQGHKRTHTQLTSVSLPSTQDQKDSTRRSMSLCWRSLGAEIESTSKTASSKEIRQVHAPSLNTNDDSSSSSEREIGPRQHSRLGFCLIKSCLLLILGLYLMFFTPQARAASSSEPLLFKHVREVVIGLSYVHSVIPVDIDSFEKHLVDYQATLERELNTVTLERIDR